MPGRIIGNKLLFCTLEKSFKKSKLPLLGIRRFTLAPPPLGHPSYVMVCGDG